VREPVRSNQVLAFILERAMDCADRLREAGIDLDAYNTVESANDVAALCAALGKKPVHVVGHSYGSHLAMALIKKHPESLVSAVLAGPEGPDQTMKMPSAVQRQLQHIAGATGERAFAGVVDAVLERLDMTPEDVKVARPDGGGPEGMRIGRFDVEWIAAAGSADTRLVRVMPSWFGRMSRGDFGTFTDTPLVARYLRHLRGGLGTSAMSYCMDCASGVSEKRWEKIEREAEAVPLGRTIDFPFPEVGLAWQVPDLGSGYRQPPKSEELPVLFITGGWDCRTPVTNLKELANGLPKHQHLHVEGAGHTDLLYDPEVGVRVDAFLNGKGIDTTPIPEAQSLFEKS
jgi:pimeloyl-ACP methyl ester carboxylesterase